MFYLNNQSTFIEPQGQGDQQKVKQAINKQSDREKKGYWYKVDGKTWKWVKKGLSGNRAKKKYHQHREENYRRNRFKKL
jgi:hypothetical protein